MKSRREKLQCLQVNEQFVYSSKSIPDKNMRYLVQEYKHHLNNLQAICYKSILQTQLCILYL